MLYNEPLIKNCGILVRHFVKKQAIGKQIAGINRFCSDSTKYIEPFTTLQTIGWPKYFAQIMLAPSGFSKSPEAKT